MIRLKREAKVANMRHRKRLLASSQDFDQYRIFEINVMTLYTQEILKLLHVKLEKYRAHRRARQDVEGEGNGG